MNSVTPTKPFLIYKYTQGHCSKVFLNNTEAALFRNEVQHHLIHTESHKMKARKRTETNRNQCTYSSTITTETSVVISNNNRSQFNHQQLLIRIILITAVTLIFIIH